MPETVLSVKENGIFSEQVPDVYLFVCTGNTCRSPMAAALFNALYPNRGVAVSAGLCAGGSPISDNAAAALEARGIASEGKNNYKAHISRQVTRDMVAGAARVYAISSRHAMALISAFPEYAEKIAVLGEIADPYGGSLDVYRACLCEIETAQAKLFGETTKESGGENG